MGLYLAQQLVNGISYGSILGLLAVGYTMIYGILGLINFAHGEVFMIGAFICYLASAVRGMPWVIGAILALVTSTAVGFLLQRYVYRPTTEKKAPLLTVFIASFAASIGLRHIVMMFYTDKRRAFPIPGVFERMFLVGGIAIGLRDIVIFIVTIAIMSVLAYFIRYSKTGMGMRAVSYDKNTAELVGVNSRKVTIAAFIIGSALAGLSALVYGLSFGIVNPSMGITPGLTAFIAAVLGGIGNVTGAMIGGFIIGLGEVLFVALLPASLSPLRPLFVWALLFVILFIKPSGLFRPNVKFEEIWE
ncbi:MAG: branched-chain amino acid ABC transporter permease [Firmicutes bacterium]|mgnify:CR=1 FL=1|nr:branched-chain amino acid ABC transporter permease [Bacillota bacterium]